jgi:hypothetical protein
MKSGIKFSTCKYCGSDNVMWERHDGKFVLFDSYGLPHACEEGNKFYNDKWKAESDRKKKLYADEKVKWNARIGSKCTVCIEGVLPGIHFNNSNSPMYCRDCDGKGTITKDSVNTKLYHIRKQLWPRMFGKQKEKV